jgi:hypothetical protein
MLKKLLGSLVVVIVVLVAGAYLLPRKVHVERSIVVNRPAAVVFPLVNSFRRFNEWSPWAALDPNVRTTYSGPEAGVGARMEWAGNSKVGTGSQVIRESVADRRVATDLDFGGRGPAKAAWLLSPEGAGTRVLWTLDLDVGNSPLGRYMGLLMDGMVGPDYARGLAQLKALAAKAPPAAAGPGTEPAQPASAPTTPPNAPTS